MRTILGHPIPALLIALILGCSQSFGPRPPGVLYVLRQVEQDPLPAVLYETDNFTVRVMADTIRLRPNGTGTMSGVRESVPRQAGQPGDGPVHIETELHFKVAGDGVEIDFDCPPLALCVPPPHLVGTLQAGGLSLRWGPHMDGRAPLLYAQVQAAP